MENQILNNMKQLSKKNAFKLYEETLTQADKVAYEIAKTQLESSFDLEKSIGFINFIKKENIEIITD